MKTAHKILLRCGATQEVEITTDTEVTIATLLGLKEVRSALFFNRNNVNVVSDGRILGLEETVGFEDAALVLEQRQSTKAGGKLKCSECKKEIVLEAGKKLHPRTGDPHECRQDVYDLPENKRLNILIPKTDRFKKGRR